MFNRVLWISGPGVIYSIKPPTRTPLESQQNLYLYFHEYIHWVAGKLFSGGISVLYRSWYGVPFLYAVKYRELTQMPDWGVRIAGIFLHILLVTVAISYI